MKLGQGDRTSVPAWLQRVLSRERPGLFVVALPGICWWLAVLALLLGAARAGFPRATFAQPAVPGLGLYLAALFILAGFAAYAFVMGFAVFWSSAAPRWRALALVADWSPALALALLLMQ